MNKEFKEMWEKAQQAWLEGCINAYGRLLDSAQHFLEMNKQYQQKAEEAVKARKDNGSGDK